MRESLDTERIAFTMFRSWKGILECDIIAKLNENFWSNGFRTI
jgi:succinate dehydrogenase flavin-adding protein (antitoxin of CptAB toxin-antitoxin module)